jgi:hypothetical protein
MNNKTTGIYSVIPGSYATIEHDLILKMGAPHLVSGLNVEMLIKQNNNKRNKLKIN